MKELIKKIFKLKQIKFLIVGVINTIVGYGSYVILVFIGMQYLLANTLSTIIGVINSYFWNRNFTFKSNNSKKKEIPKFIIVYLVSYLLSMVTLYVFVDIMSLDRYLAGLINLIVTTLISWFGHNNFSFKE